VNKEDTAYNRKLHKVVKTFKHVQIKNMSGDRRHFTNHGSHMNSLGKAWICQEIVKKIQDLFSPERSNKIIPLNWKEPQSMLPEDQITSSETLCPTSDRNHSSKFKLSSDDHRPNRRKRPVNRCNDFLWV
jgi:hypothetical protein